MAEKTKARDRNFDRDWSLQHKPSITIGRVLTADLGKHSKCSKDIWSAFADVSHSRNHQSTAEKQRRRNEEKRNEAEKREDIAKTNGQKHFVVNASHKDRRAAEKQRRRNEEKKKEAEKREEIRSKRSKSRILILLMGKLSNIPKLLIFPSQY